jgi:hypothetical protein
MAENDKGAFSLIPVRSLLNTSYSVAKKIQSNLTTEPYKRTDLHPSIYQRFSSAGGILSRTDDVASSMSEVLGIRQDTVTTSKAAMFDTNYFNRYRHIYRGDEIKSGKKYCFIVKPDLNMPEAIDKDPYFANLWKTRPYLLQALTYVNIANTLTLTQDAQSTQKVRESDFGPLGKNGISDHHFISFLSDRVLSFALPDFEVDEFKLDQPFTNFSTAYAGNSNKSRTDKSTQIQFRDTYNLDLLAFFDAWEKYIDLVSYGMISPYRDYANAAFKYGTPIIDYATSIYEIITKSDGNEIIYWAKLTGVFPTTIPHSNYQFTSTDDIDNDIEIQFSGGLPETLNPRILADFNYNAGLFVEDSSYQIATKLKPEYQNVSFVPHAKLGFEDLPTPGGSSIVGAPYITFNDTYKTYNLRWRPRPT